MMKSARLLAAITLLVAASGWGSAAGPENPTVAHILKTYCVSCHGGDKPKADLPLDKISGDFGKNSDAWKGVLDRLSDGSMPPKGKPRPSTGEMKAVTDWVSA